MARNVVVACNNVDLDVREAEIVGLVGESGSGKSTLARIALLLESCDSGKIIFNGRDLSTLGQKELRKYRRNFQIVFQDPLSALNPRWRVEQSLARPLLVHGVRVRSDVAVGVKELLDLVDLPAALARRYPHELSGGQRQRVCIARALGTRPRLVILDEPTSGLDVATQANMLDLIQRFRNEFGVAFLFITHDLRIIRHLSSRVAVMRRGEIVEFRETASIFQSPEHEYTRTLIGSVLRHGSVAEQINSTGPDNKQALEEATS
jgi:ABC-type glutathione transport system ATPase component